MTTDPKIYAGHDPLRLVVTVASYAAQQRGAASVTELSPEDAIEHAAEITRHARAVKAAQERMTT